VHLLGTGQGLVFFAKGCFRIVGTSQNVTNPNDESVDRKLKQTVVDLKSFLFTFT
jgi:hypothetical protein